MDPGRRGWEGWRREKRGGVKRRSGEGEKGWRERERK